MGKLVDATLVFDIFIWYIIVGVLIAAWAFFFLALAGAKKSTVFPKIFGAVLALWIVWLGVVSAFDSSYGFTESVDVVPLLVPVCLLVAQLAICVILVVFRRKER